MANLKYVQVVWNGIYFLLLEGYVRKGSGSSTSCLAPGVGPIVYLDERDHPPRREHNVAPGSEDGGEARSADAEAAGEGARHEGRREKAPRQGLALPILESDRSELSSASLDGHENIF